MTPDRRLIALRVLACGAPALFTAAWLLLGWSTDGYSQRADTISALARIGAPSAALMTMAFVVQGGGQLAGAALAWRTPRASWTAASLALGGVGTLAVGGFPLPGTTGPGWLSSAHALSAVAAFGGLHLAALCGASSGAVPRGLRIWGAVALVVAVGHLAWFLHDLLAGDGGAAAAGASEGWSGYSEKVFTTVLLAWCAALAWGREPRTVSGPSRVDRQRGLR